MSMRQIERARQPRTHFHRVNLTRFDGHGKSNEKREPDGSKRKHIMYKEEFRRQAVEMVIHGGKAQARWAREPGCSEYSLNLWKTGLFEATSAV
jgi:hypothetical protein